MSMPDTKYIVTLDSPPYLPAEDFEGYPTLIELLRARKRVQKRFQEKNPTGGLDMKLPGIFQVTVSRWGAERYWYEFKGIVKKLERLFNARLAAEGSKDRIRVWMSDMNNVCFELYDTKVVGTRGLDIFGV